MRLIKLLHVVGTRPNFMKIAAVMTAVERWNSQMDAGGAGAAGDGAAAGAAAADGAAAYAIATGTGAGSVAGVRFEQVLVHTGQHYDDAMSQVFFRDLALAEPDVYLDVRSGTQAEQTANLLLALEPVVQEQAPDLVLVVGDVNTTVAAALVAAKLNIAVGHVEAGLRSGDRRMPEELNRIVTDRLSRLLFTTSEAASQQLMREGISETWAAFVGNTMIDCLETTLPAARGRRMAAELGLEQRGYALMTLHRPSNVDEPEQLANLAGIIARAAERLSVVFPVHARTIQRLRASGALAGLEAESNVRLLPPVGYVDFLSLMGDARLIMTDSGGIQAESCVLGTPCITLRTTTEWPETVEAGINRLADPYDAEAVLTTLATTLEAGLPGAGQRPPLWDGQAAARVVAAIAAWAQESRAGD
jgi:UDP-N-acetylglucosamine 2-epimerase (non-hydrolysing)